VFGLSTPEDDRVSTYVNRETCPLGCFEYGRDIELELERPIEREVRARPMFQHLPSVVEDDWSDAASWPVPQDRWALDLLTAAEIARSAPTPSWLVRRTSSSTC
jgi:hypothetical protein